jgi:hypothetical protein
MMNEIELTTKIEGLKKAITEHKDFAGNYEDELKRAEQQLADINKPVLTPSQFDDITEAVEEVIGHYDFSDSDNYQIEYGIDYDGRVHCESIEFDSYKLQEVVCNKLYALFAEADCPEDDNSQLNTQTVAEKII